MSDNNPTESLAAALRVPRELLRQWWSGLALRERRLIGAAALIVLLALLWWVALAPALRTLQRAPAQLDSAEQQLQLMQRLAAEARELRGVTPVPADQAGNVLKAATARLGGDKARLALQGDRAVLTVAGVSSIALRDWLAEARSGARARTIEANLSRGSTGLTGTVVVGMGPGT
ncbi:MAG: type II secretion system protein M [Betaproteobacteria bacterium]|nr:type II secretion system protein M [Betaproteobacteria bacterium]MCC6851862.1 type II secretion system protein M [Rubrivivax sp.]